MKKRRTKYEEEKRRIYFPAGLRAAAYQSMQRLRVLIRLQVSDPRLVYTQGKASGNYSQLDTRSSL